MRLPPVRLGGVLHRLPSEPALLLPELYRLISLLVSENERQFRSGVVKPRPLLGSRIRYQRERGREHWQTAAELQRSLRGDCEDLAAYEVARLRVAGVRAAVTLEGTSAGYHAVCTLPDGRTWDPSLALGMGGGKDAVMGWY